MKHYINISIFQVISCFALSAYLQALTLYAAAGEAERLYGVMSERSVETGAFDGVFPHIVDGGGWKTAIFLTNLSPGPSHYALFLRDNDGNVLSLPFLGRGSASMIYGTLEPGRSLELETPGIGASLLQGFARLFCLDKPASDPTATVVPTQIGGYAVFRLSVAGRPDFEAIVPMGSPFENRFKLFFDNRYGFSTGVALLNPGTSSTGVSIVARDYDGNIVLQDSFALGEDRKIVFSVPDRYPQLNGRRGVLEVSGTASTLSGLALRFNPTGAFTTSNTISLAAPSGESGAGSGSGTIPSRLGCLDVMTAIIIAQDGQFLGVISSNSFSSDSIANTFGRYGSSFSSTSIYNEFGTYGSNYSSLSPWNPYASQPPLLVRSGRFLGYLTANLSYVPRISPAEVSVCIGRR